LFQISQAALENLSQKQLPKLRAALSPREHYRKRQELEKILAKQYQQDWKVEWPGHVDKRAFMVDTDQILTSFTPWGQFKVIGYFVEYDMFGWAEKQTRTEEPDSKQPADEQLSPEGILHKRFAANLNKSVS